jgi:threonine dehydrogenase-like Zn-dependent dehydrogenase
LAYGYASVGVIRETGKQVDTSWRGKLVFAFQPHTSHFIAKPHSLFPIPDSLAPESACFLPNMETAVNFVQDGTPILGERVLVLGQGVVGLLTASLLNEFPLERLVTADRFELRRKASESIGVSEAIDPQVLEKEIKPDGASTQLISQYAYAQSFDLVYELSGAPSALNDAIALTRYSGRIVIGSWYGEKRAEVALGGSFHRSRIKLISSQVSSIAPELSGRWDKARRFGVAWEALKRIQPQKWITHRFPVQDAAKAYQLLDEHPQEAIQVLFSYS